MKWYANELGYGADAEYWGIVGLLHDIEHGVCTMDGTTHKFPIGIHAIRICICLLYTSRCV